MIKGFKEFILGLLGKDRALWDGSDNRKTMRTKVDFEVEVGCPNQRYMGRAIDASPRGLRVRIRGPYRPSIIKKGLATQLKWLTPMYEAEVDTIQSKVAWVKKEGENLFLLGLVFDDTLENLQKSWVKPVLLKGLRKKVAQHRKSLRVRCNLAAKFSVNGQAMEGCLHDLSIEGARLESFQAVAEGSPIVLEAGPVGQLAPLKLNGTVKRSLRPYGTFTYGVKLHADEAEKKLLLAYIKHFHQVNKKNSISSSA